MQNNAVIKHKLKNGLTLLIKERHNIPEVDISLWYNVGSKDEEDGERGMAHLVEHMIFKGTQKLSESDINNLTNKLSGYTNAFTSYDYTAYVFSFPSNSYQYGLLMLADCMENCRFDEQMLNSELKAVIQEMKMYKDDYQGSVVEALTAAIFPEHPYAHPIIGYKQDLWSLNRDDLYRFYKKHYHPGNATLSIVGDVNTQEVIANVEKYFGHITQQLNYQKKEFFFRDDVEARTVELYRDVENFWACYAYKIPGFKEQKSHLFYMLSLILGKGKSAKLYERLVNQEKLANDLASYNYDLHEKDLFFVGVQPKDKDALGKIELIIQEEIDKLYQNGLEEWEFERIRKKAEMDYLNLLESNEEMCATIGGSYLATGDENFIEKYIEQIKKASFKDLKEQIHTFLRPTLIHKGFLYPIEEKDKKLLMALQEESDELDKKILEKKIRTTEIEDEKFTHEVEIPQTTPFSYPKPKEFKLNNSLDVLFYDTRELPKIALILNFKGDFLHESEDLAGLSNIHSKMLLQGTTKRSATEMHQLIESRGIHLRSDSGYITMEFLEEEFSCALEILSEIILCPKFDESDLNKIKEQAKANIKDYWDTPIQFVDQLARKMIYKNHPYAKPARGTLETVSKIDRNALLAYHKQFITPKGTTLVVVGDLQRYTNLSATLEKQFNTWTGINVNDLSFPKVEYAPTKLNYKIERDQVVLGLVAPSLSRLSPDYDAMAIFDNILLGGATGSMSSRLFELREQTGLFYTIGGSAVYNAQKDNGMVFIKTIVSPDKVEIAEKLIKETVEKVLSGDVSEEEFLIAKNALINSTISVFESPLEIARAFLFLKKFNFSFDLFDKRGSKLSIINLESMIKVANRYCKPELLSTIRVGRGR